MRLNKLDMRRIIVIFYLFYSSNTFANKDQIQYLSEQEVINSVTSHYPKILSYYQKVDAAFGNYLASQGFFDITLVQEYQDKTRGFYDGKITDSRVEKQNSFLGSKIYTGYRKSFGSFPKYEENALTNHDGEIRAGVKFSLIKNSTIDQNRLGVMISELGMEESKAQLENIKIEIQRDALKAYWSWVITGKIHQIYLGLYDLAIKREEQLENLLRKGGVAEIIIVENKKNILRRKNAELEAKRDFENSAIYLSLFLRDNLGNLKIPKPERLPEAQLSLEEISSEKSKHDVEDALLRRPEIKIIKIKKNEEIKNLEYSKNLFKPKLDIETGISKDLGNGLESRSKTNNFVKVEFEIPLQFREARGKIMSSQSKISAIRHEEQLVSEKIKVEIEQFKNNLHNSIEMYKNFKEEVRFSEILENAEREKFKHGASNFFLVNMREQDTASAKAAKLIMFKKYQDSLIDYKAALFKFE
jgi:outer membrane protein TolC